MTLSVRTLVIYFAIQLINVPAFAAPIKPTKDASLFAKGAEVFKVVDEKGKTPQFRLLDDSMAERALAMAAIATLNAQDEVQPKIPNSEYIDLKIESLKIEPVADQPQQLQMTLKLSGYEVPVDRTIDRAKFISGQWIDMSFPKSDRNLSMFDVSSSGKVRFRLEPKTLAIQFERVEAKVNYVTAFGDRGDEQIRFSGRGVRMKQ